MIQETQTRKLKPAITSDRWHVVRAMWTDRNPAEARFDRTIVSEHPDRAEAVRSAQALVHALKSEMADRPTAKRDQVFVRAPCFKSFKSTRRPRTDGH